MREIESKSNMAFQEISSQLPEIQSNTEELRNSLHGTINRVKVIEHTHQDRLENLFEGKEAMKEEILTLQTKLNNSYKIIHSLQYDSTRYQNTTNTLLQKMNKVESLLASHEQSTHRETNDIRAQLGNINDLLRSSDAQSCKLSNSLTETRNEVIQVKVASSLGLKEISDILNSHGIHQPQWNIVIEYGGIYERNAKENNYVSPINVISDGGEAIDIPSTLASFAHDYAAWTAFTADHEDLKLVIIGKNPDTINALEVDIEERRTIVVER
jgi:predicted RNase H-like nuclease (RuvC/YqgF family)